MAVQKLVIISIAALAIWAIWTPTAAAYLDPGTGSLIVQSMIGVVAGALIALKLYWRQIKMLFSAKGPEKPGKDNNLD